MSSSRADIPIYKNPRATLVKDESNTVDFVNSRPRAGRCPFNPSLQLAPTCFKFATLTGLGEGRYEAMRIDGSQLSALDTFFRSTLSRRNELSYWLNNKDTLIQHAKTVFVASHVAGPLGKMLALITFDGRRASSLLVALFGNRNFHPCEECGHRMSRNKQALDRNKEYFVMVPFFECRSIPALSKGACANCLWHVEAEKCTYQSSADVVQKCAATDPDQPEGDNFEPSALIIGQTCSADPYDAASMLQAEKEKQEAAVPKGSGEGKEVLRQATIQW